MDKRYKRILTLIISFFVMSTFVSAENINIYISKTNDENGQRIYRTAHGDKGEHLSIGIGPHSTQTKIGYCLDYDKHLDDRVPTFPLEGGLLGYIKSIITDENKAKEVTKKINQYVIFGYNTTNQNSTRYQIATQKLIWDELYYAGYRQDQYSPDITFSSGGNNYDITKEEETIKNNIKNYYKTPSFCSSNNKIELAVGETATFEDTNGVLSLYNVSCDESLSCIKKGNKLTITANSEAKSQNISFTKSGITGEGSIVYRKEKAQQAVLVSNESIDGISCNFGVDSYVNVKTGEPNLILTITIAIIAIFTAYTYLFKIQNKSA